MTWIASAWIFGLVASLAAALCLGLLYRGLVSDRSRGRPRCPKCWYSMQAAASLICPECGHDARAPRRLHRTRRHWRLVTLAVLLAAATLYGHAVRHRVVSAGETWRQASVPTTALIAMLSADDPDAFDRLQSRYSESRRPWCWQERWLVHAASRVAWRATAPLDERAARLVAATAARLDAGFDASILLAEHPREEVRQTAVWGLRLGPTRVAELSDARIERYVTVAHKGFGVPDGYLLEILRRRRPPSADFLRSLLSAPDAQEDFDGQRIRFLTTLRRLESRPDPLHVAVEGPLRMECAAAKLPTLAVSVVNVDPEGIIRYHYGGDNRGPRQERWRFDVRDAHGDPIGNLKPTYNFGGLGSWKNLARGERWSTTLDMNDYLDPLPPGPYTLIVQHHTDSHISAAKDIRNYIVILSDPIELIVN